MNKSKLKKQAKDILNSHPVGYVFSMDDNESKFLLRIFQGHPEYSIKVGFGIQGLSIGIGGEYKTRCFILTRVDGSTTDISYIRSIDGATTKLSDIKCACRSAISDIIQGFRMSISFGNDTCPVTKTVLNKDNTHIDHYDLTFDELFNKWISGKNIDQLHELLNDTTKDHETEIFFTCLDTKNEFVKFHNQNTHLRAVSKTANLSLLKRKYNKIK